MAHRRFIMQHVNMKDLLPTSKAARYYYKGVHYYEQGFIFVIDTSIFMPSRDAKDFKQRIYEIMRTEIVCRQNCPNHR